MTITALRQMFAVVLHLLYRFKVYHESFVTYTHIFEISLVYERLDLIFTLVAIMPVISNKAMM